MGVVTLGANRCCTRSIATTWKLIPLPLIRNSRKKRGVCRWTCRKWTFCIVCQGKHIFYHSRFSAISKKKELNGATLSSQNFSGSPRQMRRKWGAALSGCDVWICLVHMLPDGLFSDSRFPVPHTTKHPILVGFQTNHLRGVVVHLPVVARSLKGFFKKHAGGQCSLDVVKRSNLHVRFGWTSKPNQRRVRELSERTKEMAGFGGRLASGEPPRHWQ